MSLENRFTHIQSKAGAADKGARQTAFEYYKSHGLPTRKDEDWKYTSLQFLEKQSFKEAPSKAPTPVPTPEFHTLLIVNGCLQESKIKGVKIGSSPWTTDKFDDGLMALNFAMTETNVKIEIPEGTALDKPLCLFYVAEGEQVLNQPVVDILVGKGARLTLIEHFVGQGLSTTNQTTRIEVQADANLTYIHCQEQDTNAYHLARTHFRLAQGAHVESLSFSSGAVLSRHTQKCVLAGAGAYIKSLGLYVVSDKQHSDHTGLIDHEVGGCTSFQIYKGLLADQGRGVFNGRVLIRPGSQKAFSEQQNKNLLLSSAAEVDSKPQLEIFADDVQARHGSTVGQLNKDEIFYLNSRGISTDKALPLLTYGFLSEIIFHLADEQVHPWLLEKLKSRVGLLSAGSV